MKVPATAEHLALLRTVVHYYAGRASLTLDQIDDLKMAVDESGVLLLKHASGNEIVLELAPSEEGIQVRMRAEVPDGAPVIDDTSFSWQILRALSDEVRVNSDGGSATIVLVKHFAALAGEDTA